MKNRILPVIIIFGLTVLGCNLPALSSTTESANTAVTETSITESPTSVIEPTLQMDKSEYNPGEEITIHFTAPASYASNAWVGIVPSTIQHGIESENDTYGIEFFFLDGRSEGVIVFSAPQDPGSYDIRMFDTDDDGQEVFSINVTVTEQQPEDSTPVSCRGVSLALPNDIATGVTCEVVPVSEGGADYPIWETYPEYDRLHIDGYILQGTFHEARIDVFPIAEYEAMNEEVANTIAELRQILSEQPENPQSIPFLSFFNAAQMIRTKIVYMDFQNGSGVRFLTQYGQAAYPVNNNSLFYTFQGITSDGKYYVSAVLPVNHPNLPATSDDVPNGDWAAFSENFGIYIADMTLEMDAYADNSFTPDVTLLDNLIKSLKAE